MRRFPPGSCDGAFTPAPHLGSHRGPTYPPAAPLPAPFGSFSALFFALGATQQGEVSGDGARSSLGAPPPWGRDFERAAAAALLPSDPLVDVAGAHGYKHAQPQRTRQMPLASNASAVDETGARECRGAHPWGWGPT